MSALSDSPTPLRLPLVLSHTSQWPYHFLVTDADGNEVLHREISGYSTAARSLDDVLTGRGFAGEEQREVVAAIQRTRAQLEYLVAAANYCGGHDAAGLATAVDIGETLPVAFTRLHDEALALQAQLEAVRSGEAA